nr:TIGR03960 family B12-binding radical SAM protein [uncultured Solibaculum sp.]
MRQEIDRILPLVQKPGRYSGGELNCILKDPSQVKMRIAFCFPDVYEVGMSHLGMKILYGLFNQSPDIWCERVFAPWPDMQEQMEKHQIPLFALESRDAVGQFDWICFTLQYELSFTNILNMIRLAGLPIRAQDRGNLWPLVICGGPCACNPEPLCDFVDAFILGEGEEVNMEVAELYLKHKEMGSTKQEFLKAAAQIPGVYVPSLYDVSYHEDGTIQAVTPLDGAPAKVTKRIVKDMSSTYYPDKFVVPYIEVVHDRAMTEIFRGCIRGCRFCQAGFIYRPVREKNAQVIAEQSRVLCESTGYDEISLTSLSTSDYSQLKELLPDLLQWSEDEKVNLSLPSLRVDNFSPELLEQLNKVRKSGLTFAPEAGTQRLRDAINKNVSEEEIMRTCRIAFEGGHTSVKLYFMLSLPTETLDDVAGIAQLGQRIVDLYYRNPNKPKGKGVQVTISCAVFVPKPFTPFQWEPQDPMDVVKEKQKHLVSSLTTRKINCNWHDAETSFLEAVFARGDRRLGRVMEAAFDKGCTFDSWEEFFQFDKWMEAFEQCGIDPAFYANRRRSFDEVLPWDHLDYGVDKSFLIREAKKAYESQTTPHCRLQCSGCGANRLKGGPCF